MTTEAAAAQELNVPDWTDSKRYAWMLGLLVPLLPFIAFGLAEATGLGDHVVVRPGPRVRDLPGARPDRRHRRREPARQRDQVARAGPLLPLDHVRLHPDPVRRPRLRLLHLVERRPDDDRKRRPRGLDGDGRRHRDQHRPRARAQARQPRALAQQGRARAERLRPLLHRAQPRPPRARRDARGSGQLALRRELLVLPPAHRGRQLQVGVGARGRARSTGWARRTGRSTTTCSTRGR